MQDIDRIHEANVALDRRARQREAAAAISQQLTPEILAAEKERQERIAKFGPDAELISQDESHFLTGGPSGELTLQQKMEAAAEEALAAAHEAGAPDDTLGIGRCVFQWILVPSDEEDNRGGLQLALTLQVDEFEPAGFVAEIYRDQLDSWAKGKGLQGNRIEHTQFVQALLERIIPLGVTETANHLIFTLEQQMQEGTWVAGHYVPPYRPTETAVGDDEEEPSEVWEMRTQADDEADTLISESPFADAPENAGEVPE